MSILGLIIAGIIALTILKLAFKAVAFVFKIVLFLIFAGVAFYIITMFFPFLLIL